MEEPETVWMRIVLSEAPMAIWSVVDPEIEMEANFSASVAVSLRALS